jgi:hypothetical protein
MASVIDITGQRFGELVVVCRIPHVDFHNGPLWLFRCSCGREFAASKTRVSTGQWPVKSCLKCRPRVRRQSTPPTHRGKLGGLSKSSEYQIYRGMRQRCENPKDSVYGYYGGRGIHVCDRWKASFLDFFADVGPRPSKEYSLDRIDNDGNYEPGNVRWATDTEQARNKRRAGPPRVPSPCPRCGVICSTGRTAYRHCVNPARLKRKGTRYGDSVTVTATDTAV